MGGLLFERRRSSAGRGIDVIGPSLGLTNCDRAYIFVLVFFFFYLCLPLSKSARTCETEPTLPLMAAIGLVFKREDPFVKVV